MSPAAKSKSKAKDKSSAKAVKEQQKVSSKTSGSNGSVSGDPASAYNSFPGALYSVDTAAGSISPTFQNGGRLRNVDERNEYSGSSHGTAEYDTVSTNGSCSGESEDPKEKTSAANKQETLPSCDNDKREKIRQKNERKHQRQKERRAQELHERCCGYLMSRKLEGLSQQLVAMGFSSERATLALMVNGGKLEESVSWLFDANEQETQTNSMNHGNAGQLKLNISDELAQILVLEGKYKCTKQEVERAIIACEGDLEKAEETLKEKKQEKPAPQPKVEETPKVNVQVRPQEKVMPSAAVQPARMERDFSAAKIGTTPMHFDPGSRNVQLLKMNQQKLMDPRWPSTAHNPSVSYSYAPPMQHAPPSSMLEARQNYMSSEGRNYQQVSVRDQVMMLQRPQSVASRQNPVSSAPPPELNGWYSNNRHGNEIGKPSRPMLHSQSRVHMSQEGHASQQFNHQAYSKQYAASNPMNIPSSGMEGSWNPMGSSTPSLAVPSSLGLFSGLGSTANPSSSSVDWNTGGSMPNCDYTNIDWTLDGNSSSSKSNGLWMGLSSLLKNNTGANMSSRNRAYLPEMQDHGMTMEAQSSANTREWTSPFAGNDIFSVPRQFVSPSL